MLCYNRFILCIVNDRAAFDIRAGGCLHFVLIRDRQPALGIDAIDLFALRFDAGDFSELDLAGFDTG